MSEVFVSIKDTAFFVKITNHNSDPSKLVLKSKHPEVGSMLAAASGLSALDIKSEKGNKYFITFVPKASFQAGLGKVLLEMVAGNMSIKAPETMPIYKDLSDMEAPDDEDDDEEEDY